jgi:ribose transport system permease protein
VWPAALAAVLAGLVVGVINGVLVAYARIASILVTLATMIVIKGVALTVADRNTVSGIDIGTSLWMQSPLGLLFSPTSLLAIGVVVVVQLVLSQTVAGRTLYVIGGSDDGGRLSGIPTERYLVAAFAACGGLAAAAGVVLSLGLNTGSAYFGDSTVFTVVAAVVVGGTSLLGAEGSAIKSAMGVLFMAVIAFAFAMRGMPTFILQVVTGAILLSIVLLDSYLGLRRRRAWRLRRIAVRQDEATAEPAGTG